MRWRDAGAAGMPSHFKRFRGAAAWGASAVIQRVHDLSQWPTLGFRCREVEERMRTRSYLSGKRQARWLAVVAVVGLAGCPSTVKQLGKREIAIDVLWVAGDGPQVHEGTADTVVRLEPNQDGKVRVGIFEGASLETGSMWRSSVWMAAFGAALATQRNLEDWTLSVEDGGIDGPSAGGLLTAAIMAGMTGAPTKSDFTMTGTVNPDGTIGPVGGIPHKFAAAIAEGKTRLGYPVGQRYDLDRRTRQLVDLRSAFTDKDVEVFEIEDVYQAYELMTGRRLPRPRPVVIGDMDVPENVYKALEKGAHRSINGIKQHFAAYKRLGFTTPLLEQRWTKLDGQITEVDRLLREGLAPASHAMAGRMFTESDATLILANLMKRIQDNPAEGIKYADGIFPNVDRRLGELYGELKKVEPRSPSDVMTLVDACGATIRATRSYELARRLSRVGAQQVARLIATAQAGKAPLQPADYDAILNAMMEPMLQLIDANAQTHLARHHLSFRDDETTVAVTDASVGALATMLRNVARANVKYFEATTVNERAKAKGVSLAVMQQSFDDVRYRSASDTLFVVDTFVKPNLGADSRPFQVAQLSGAMSVYLSAAMLIAKYYSLRFRTDATGALVGVEREKAFITMLTLAERMAREHAAQAKQATGRIPVPSQIAYQVARTYRERPSFEAKAEALEQFWRSSLLSQLVVQLEGRVGSKRK